MAQDERRTSWISSDRTIEPGRALRRRWKYVLSKVRKRITVVFGNNETRNESTDWRSVYFAMEPWHVQSARGMLADQCEAITLRYSYMLANTYFNRYRLPLALAIRFRSRRWWKFQVQYYRTSLDASSLRLCDCTSIDRQRHPFFDPIQWCRWNNFFYETVHVADRLPVEFPRYQKITKDS